MKNIEILMKDKLYANKLNNALNTMYVDINSKIILNLEEKAKNSLLIIDQENLNGDKNYLYLNYENKYKHVNDIYNLILEKYKSIELDFTKQEVITFVNLSEVKSINNEATKLAKYYSKLNETLLINFNYFGKYINSENEISIDSLLFIRDKMTEISSNIINELHYLKSSNLPFEAEKCEYIRHILEIIKHQKYKKIIIDLSFNISSRNIEILQNSDTIIFFSNSSSESSFIESTKSFIKKHLSNKYLEINLEKHPESYKLEMFNSFYNLKNIDEVVEVYDKNKWNKR